MLYLKGTNKPAWRSSSSSQAGEVHQQAHLNPRVAVSNYFNITLKQAAAAETSTPVSTHNKPSLPPQPAKAALTYQPQLMMLSI